jgi:GNAT superfamily N-acetyltransferase
LKWEWLVNVEIRLSVADDAGKARKTEIASLINRVYAEAEEGMWQPEFHRVQLDEVEQLIIEQKLILAILKGRIIGSVFVTQLNDTLGEFGMLVCEPEYRHQGTGRKLIDAAEKLCLAKGCSAMQLELLYPRHWLQKSKEILKVWYPKLGYVKGGEQNFNSLYPQLAPVLATECVFSVYTKRLK